MSAPPVVFGEPESELRQYLREAFALRTEPYKATTVTAAFPAESGYHVQVELESSAADYPLVERCQLRLTCWAPKGQRTDVKALASLTRALVAAWSGTAAANSAPKLRGGRSAVITDPDTGYLMCWFLARVDLKPTVLAP